MSAKNMTLHSIFIVAILLSIPQVVQAQYTILDTFGDLAECDTMTRGIYIVWWDNDNDYSSQVDEMLDSLVQYRSICLNELGMEDPPNPTDGYYFNIYVHGGGYFGSNGWGNGVGTDSNGYPFYTAPTGVLTDWNTIAHEGFHMFQYSANSPGFVYAGDSQWYIEASANWFGARQNPNSLRRFVEAESLVRVPHVPLWLSFGNFPSYFPENWQRYVHQYALALHLYYLTDVAGVSEDIITSGLYGMTDERPQEYMYNLIGGMEFRKHFIDWAAHMTNDFDFIPADQVATNLNEWNNYADPDDDNEFIGIYENEETNGWVSPTEEDVTHAWSFNTYKLINSQIGSYTFELNGAPHGTYGDDSFFQGQLLVKNSVNGATFYDLNMSNDQQGSLTINVTPEENEIYFIVASMPEVFEDNNPTFQQFHYEVKISFDEVTSVVDVEGQGIRTELARFNLFGQKVEKKANGIQLIQYDDGSVEKVFLNGN